MDYTANAKVETTAKSFQLIERLAAVEEAGVSELSDDLDMSKSIVHNHLSTLRELGYVRKRADRYRLSLRFLEVGVQVRANSPLFQIIERKVAIAAKRFETAACFVERDGSTGLVTIVRDESDTGTLAVDVGDRLTLTESPLGLALLSILPEHERNRIVTESDENSDRIREHLRDEGGVVTRTLSDSAGTIVATGVANRDHTGAVGVRTPPDASDGTERAIRQMIESLSSTQSAGNESKERSFTTTKHSWFSE